MPVRLVLACLIVACVAPFQAIGRDRLPGPVPAQVLRVIDGDTVEVRAAIWLGQTLQTKVRIDGIDSPELRARCDAEREMALHAKQYLERTLRSGVVTLHNISYGKFAGRVVAEVRLPDGLSAGAAMIAAGLARANLRGPRAAWC